LDVLVSVRRALGGTDLGQLRAGVEREFLTLDKNEQSVRAAVAKMEAGFLRRFASLQRE
jgi:F-type H+-transporting ATPase subunit epsilon